MPTDGFEIVLIGGDIMHDLHKTSVMRYIATAPLNIPSHFIIHGS